MKKNAPLITEVRSSKKKESVAKPTATVNSSSMTIPNIVEAGARMSAGEFEAFVQKMAPESFWPIMAEYYRLKLEESTRENQQLHDIVDALEKDNEHLRPIADHCEYLTNMLEKLIGDDNDAKASVCVRLF